MKDGNVGVYGGVEYVAEESRPMSCDRCGGKRTDGSVDHAFCNAMPNCMADLRRDRRNVVFVEKKAVVPA